MKSTVSRLARLAASLVLLALAGCAGIPNEPQSRVHVERDWGFAGGESEAEALRLATVIEEVRAAYMEIAEYSELPLRAHWTDDIGRLHLSGLTAWPSVGSPWIAVRRDGENVEHTVAHELAHFYFHDALQRLPTILEEGFCECLAEQVFPAPELKERRMALAGASYLDRFTIEVFDAGGRESLPYLVQPVPSVDELFEHGWRETWKSHVRVNEALYGLGTLLAARIGLPGVLDLGKRAEEEGLALVPAKWIRVAAGIEPPTDANLRRALMAAMDLPTNPEASFTITLRGASESE